MNVKINLFIIVLVLTSSFRVFSQEELTNFQIKTDPRIELLSIFLNYTDWSYFGKFDNISYPYYERVKDHFDKFQDHSSVVWFLKASEKWNLDDPASLMLWLSDPPQMTQKFPNPLHPTCQLDTAEFRMFIQKLNQFCNDTEFEKFWNENLDFYIDIERNINDLVPHKEYVKLMSDFYGETKNSFVIIPAPLFKGISFGPQLTTERGKVPYFITALTMFESHIPTFKKETLTWLIFHEFGHSFVNPICEKYRKEIFNYSDLFQYLKTDMSAIAYPDWFPTFHEHVVRAGENILLEKAGYTKESENNYKENLRLGFTLLPFFRERLIHYDRNREKYDSFEDFFPELLCILNEIEPEKSIRSVKPGIYFEEKDKKLHVRKLIESSCFNDKVKVGDILVLINNEVVNSMEDSNKFMDLWYRDSFITLQILRDGNYITIKQEIPKEEYFEFKLKK